MGNEIKVFGNEPADETDLYIWVINPNGAISFRQVDLRKLGNQSLTKVVYNTRQEGIGVRGRGLAVVSANTENSRSTVATSTSQIQQLYQLIIQPIADILPKQTGDRFKPVV